VVFAAALTASGASAAPPKGGTVDISGMWIVQSGYTAAKLRPAPVLTPEIQALRQRRQAANANGYYRSLSNMMCQGGGGPALSLMNSPFEILQDFGRVTFIFETETFLQPRTVYLKEKTQPDNIFPSSNGHSIGHWEGKTLVVDSFPGGVPASEQAHIVERFSLSKDGKVLTDILTMTDPKSLAQPWTTTVKYDRDPPTEELIQVSCEPDLDAIKALDLPALKDADPEVARMLNASHPADPALKIAAKPN
jgi:hypothetical protein